MIIACTQGLVCAIAIANGRHENPGASDYYVRSFLKRHPEITELKSSNVGHHRAKQATKAVRDAVFSKMQVCTHTTIAACKPVEPNFDSYVRHTYTYIIQGLLDRLVASEVLTAYERDYELDKLTWYYDEMGGGVEGKRKKTFGSSPVAGTHYRSCSVTTG